MEEAPEGTKNEEKSEKEPEVRHGDVARVSSRKSAGDVPKNSELKKSSSYKIQDAEKLAKAPFTNTRRKMRSFRQGVKKFWYLWSGFTRSSAPVTPKKKKRPQIGVPGFEEIACIDVDMPDIMMTDKDRIRTSCKQCLKNPPNFPTKEQVKSKLIAADKYYGVNRLVHKRDTKTETSGSLEHDADYFDEDGKIVRPSWRFIIERPLVEQYVLMTNYIRKISILSELEGTQNDQTIEEEDSGSDTEYDKFTEKHKLETQLFLASMRAPTKKETAVQTSTKSVEGLVEPVSETSLYPDSGSSNESSPSKRELSAITIITSHDFSSPLQSDLENRSIVTAARVKNAVKWWESKEPPQTSESFPTSCDSVRDVSGSVSKWVPAIHNEPVKDTSGSGSDGMSIPVHNATGKISLFKLDARENNQDSGARIETGKRSNQDTPMTVEKGTTTQKKVTFSPVVEYFSGPQKNNAIFSLPKQYEEDNNAETTREPIDAPLQSLQETQNQVQNKTLFTLSPNQKQIILQLGSTPKEANRGFSIVQNRSMRERPGIAARYFKQHDTNQPTANDKQLLSENKVPVKPFTADKPGSSTEYRSTSPETVNALSSSDYRSSPERMYKQLGRHEKQSEENKESSSNSSERIELKPSPAVFFKPGDASAITSLATDKFYPEVPDIDEGKEEGSYQKSKYREERRDVCSFPVFPTRVSPVEGRQLNRSAANEGFVKVVIVGGTTPHTENKVNQIQINNHQKNKYNMNSHETVGRNEPDHLQHSSSKQQNSRRMGPEQFHEKYPKIVDHPGQASHVPENRQFHEKYPKIVDHPGQARHVPENRQFHEKYPKIVDHPGQASHVPENRQVVASTTRQTSLYSTLLDDLHAVASTPLNIYYRDPSGNHMDMQQSNFHPRNTEQQQNEESRISRTQQQRNAYQDLQKIPKLSSGAQFLGVQSIKDCTIQSTTRPVKSITEELQNDLKRETPYVDHQERGAVEYIYDRNIMNTENNLKGPPRTNIVTSTLSSNNILRKISEELDNSSTEIRLDSVGPIRSGVHLESQEKVRDRASYEDFSKFDVLKMSQIYSSSSSFVTPSEERMAFGLNKVEGTLFQPILVEDITPEVSMMPSKTERSIVSSDRIASINNASNEINELEKNKCPSQEQTVDEQEINYLPLTQIQYPTQFEMLTPCYTLVGNMQYSMQNEVEIRTDEMIFTTIPQVMDEEDNEVIESNIEYVLQRVHETINQTNNQTTCNQSEVKNEDSNDIAPKQWLMDIIPTVIKTSTKTSVSRQHSVNPKLQFGGSSSATPNQSDVKPVFKFLKRQKEMEKNEE